MTNASAPLHILLLAAGASSRMRGADKLLETVNGHPLLHHIAMVAIRTGLPVTVTLPPNRPLRNAAITGLAVTGVTATDADQGMAHSLRAGLVHIPGDAAVMLLLADLPEITTADLQLIASAQAANPDAIIRATAADGTPGHPVVFPPWARSHLLQLTGDKGAHAIIKAHPDRVQLVTLSDQHATTDLDTPEAWAAWHLGRQ